MKRWQCSDGQVVYQVLSGRCNAYVIGYKENYVLVDTGGQSKYYVLRQNLTALGVKEGNLKALILTHSHYDHVENTSRLQKDYGLEVVIHQEEVEFLRTGESPPIRGSVFFTKWLEKFLKDALEKIGKYTAVTPNYIVKESMDLCRWGLNGKLCHTPGHSIGSLCIILNDEIALVGDTLFGIVKGSVYPPYVMDQQDLLESWRKLIESGCHTFLPGHGKERNQLSLQNTYKKQIEKGFNN